MQRTSLSDRDSIECLGLLYHEVLVEVRPCLYSIVPSGHSTEERLRILFNSHLVLLDQSQYFSGA